MVKDREDTFDIELELERIQDEMSIISAEIEKKMNQINKLTNYEKSI